MSSRSSSLSSSSSDMNSRCPYSSSSSLIARISASIASMSSSASSSLSSSSSSNALLSASGTRAWAFSNTAFHTSSFTLSGASPYAPRLRRSSNSLSIDFSSLAARKAFVSRVASRRSVFFLIPTSSGCSSSFSLILRILIRYCVIFVSRCFALCTMKFGQYTSSLSICSRAVEYRFDKRIRSHCRRGECARSAVLTYKYNTPSRSRTVAYLELAKGHD